MGLLDIGLGLITGGITGGMNDIRQENMQQRLTEMQKEAQLDIWDKTNYEAQVKHIKNAGLNPAMLYAKGGGGGQLGSISGGQAPTGGGELQKGMEIGLMNSLQAAQVENLKADTEKKKVEAAKTAGVDTELGKTQIANITQSTNNAKADYTLKLIDTDLKELELDFQSGTLEERKRAVTKGLRLLEQNIQQLRINNEINEATKNDRIKMIHNEGIGIILRNTLTVAQTANVKQGTIESESRVKLNEKDIEVKAQQISNLISQKGTEWGKLEEEQKRTRIMEELKEWNTDAGRWAADKILQLIPGGRGTTETITQGIDKNGKEYGSKTETRRY